MLGVKRRGRGGKNCARPTSGDSTTLATRPKTVHNRVGGAMAIYRAWSADL